MTSEKEHALVAEAQKGNKEAMMELLNDNIRWIRRFIRSYPGYFIEDLEQEAKLGFIEGVLRFNPEKSTRLYFLAFAYVRAFVYRHTYYANRILRHSHKYKKQFIANGVPQLVELREEDLVMKISLEDLILQREREQILLKALSALSEREQMILTRMIMNEERAQDIGETLNLTRQRVCQIKDEALEKLRFRLRKQEKNL